MEHTPSHTPVGPEDIRTSDSVALEENLCTSQTDANNNLQPFVSRDFDDPSGLGNNSGCTEKREVQETNSPGPTPEDDSKYPSGVRLAIITIGLMLATFVVALDNTIISTAIPTITSDFDSLGDVGWYGSSYLLTTTSLQPSFGKIYTYYNIKSTFLLAVAIFEVGSIVCATAPNSTALILGRAVAGIGASAIFSGAMTIIGYTVPLRNRAVYIALLTSIFGISSIVGPLIGGAFTDNLTWRWCFWVNLPMGGVTLVSTAIFFKNPEKENSHLTFKEKLREIDLLGAGLLVSAVVCLFLALQWGGTTHPWSDSRVWGCLLGFGLLSSAFIILQFRLADRATIPPRIISQRTVASSCLFMFFLSMGLYVHIYYLPFYFQAVKGTTAEGSGIRTIPYLVSNTIATVIVGGLIRVVGWYSPFMWVGSAIFSVGSGFLYLLKVDTSTARWIGYQLLSGIGMGLAVQVPFISVQVVLSQKDIAVGSALVIFSNSLGGALAVSIAQNIFSNSLTHELVNHVLPSQMDPHIIVNAGATQIRTVTPAALLPLVLKAYDIALTRAYILPIGAGGLAFICSLGMEWKSVKGNKISIGGGQ